MSTDMFRKVTDPMQSCQTVITQLLRASSPLQLRGTQESRAFPAGQQGRGSYRVEKRNAVRRHYQITRSRLICPAAVATDNLADGPKTGLVGPQRFQHGALRGTYHGLDGQDDEKIDVVFEVGAGKHLSIQVPAGSNLLRAAEAADAVTINRDFCFEGSCELCQFEVETGAQELGSKAQPGKQELVRGCLTPVPTSQSGTVYVKVLSEEDVWAEGVL